MAIDQRDVSSTLRFMDDRALQQYAAMHKNDPYIFPLAFQESQNRQRLRMSQQGAQGMQPQPKVADQALSQMAPQQLPEEMGIGALPAPNMQSMADGGIAGYADGDLISRSEPVVMMADGGVARYQVGGVMGDIPGFVAGTGNIVPQQGAPEEEPILRRLWREFSESNQQARQQERDRRTAEGRSAPSGKATAGTSPAQDMAMFDAASNLYMTEREAAKAGKTVPTTTTSGAPSTAPRAPGAGRPAPAAPSAAARYASMQEEMGLKDRESVDTERAGLAAALRKTAADEAAEFEKDVAARGEAFKGKEARLAAREAGFGKQKDETAGLSLLEAGLAIMSTPGSLATAIGKGAQTGLKTYSAGLKDLRAAQEKLDDARDQIEEFRRNEANMTSKERRQLKSNINRTENEIQKMAVDAAEKMYGYKREDAKAVFTADTQERITDKEIQGRKEAAQISASQPNAQMQIAMALGKGNLEDGLRKVAEIQAGKFSVSNSYADYLKAFAGKETISPPLSFANYAAQFGATLPR